MSFYFCVSVLPATAFFLDGHIAHSHERASQVIGVPTWTRITGTRDQFIIKVFHLSTLLFFLQYQCQYPHPRQRTWQNLHCPEEEDTHPLEEGGRGEEEQIGILNYNHVFQRNLSKALSNDCDAIINEDLHRKLLQETSSRSTQGTQQILERETGFWVSH